MILHGRDHQGRVGAAIPHHGIRVVSEGSSMIETTGDGSGGVLDHEDQVTLPVGYSMTETIGETSLPPAS